MLDLHLRSSVKTPTEVNLKNDYGIDG
jgi:hypothetical protein